MMPDAAFSETERKLILEIARLSLEQAVRGNGIYEPDLNQLPPRLREIGASFVTLTEGDDLRGCIGRLEADAPLAVDVCIHAAAAALEDYRFPPVQPVELPHIHVEVSVLTPTQPLAYTSPEDLLNKLRPGIDGVMIRDGFRRATFLPQVWEKVEDKADFMTHLCEKMSAPGDLWKRKHLDVSIYQVIEIHEPVIH